MSQHNFPIFDMKIDRLKRGLCTECGEENPMNDRRLGCIDPLCPMCRKKYDEKVDDLLLVD